VLPPPNDGFEAAEISGNDARNTLSVLIFVPHRSFFCSQHGTQRAADRLHFLISICVNENATALRVPWSDPSKGSRKCQPPLHCLCFSRLP
jgi:hypothetical protein